MQCPTLALPCNVSFTKQTAIKSTYFGGTPVSEKNNYVDSMFSSFIGRIFSTFSFTC